LYQQGVSALLVTLPQFSEVVEKLRQEQHQVGGIDVV
jgi:hypothetical protein